MFSTTPNLFCISVTFLAFSCTSNALAQSPNIARDMIEQFTADQDSLKFKYQNPNSTVTHKRMTEFYSHWKNRLSQLDFDSLDTDGKIDFTLLTNYVNHEAQKKETQWRQDRAAAKLVPFLEPLNGLLDEQELTKAVDPRKVAAIFENATKDIKDFDRSTIQNFSTSHPTLILRSISQVQNTLVAIGEFHRFGLGYNPLYTFWAETPYEALVGSLKSYADELKSTVYGNTQNSEKIIGQPIGRKEIDRELRAEFIPYSLDDLLNIANQEMAWCDQEMEKAAQALGHKNWVDAQNEVKTRFVQPGEQPKLINELAQEAIHFLQLHDLITIPLIAKESWRMKMMSPERQKMSPYFLGGHTILVSFPTGSMPHRDKLMSMRGNNRHFARATVHHELIPGHHLQYFMNKRHKNYRKLFNTPFWLEGWAVYWEMLLWDLNFARSNEDKIGMLFWRKHRCARILFSLGYHSGEMHPQECIDFLVDRVGHERNNAAAEVRRSVMGGYGPLYQAAYMIGALQFRKLHRELVQSGKMTNREFHDAVLRENNIPIELLRAKLLNRDVPRDFQTRWRFSDRN
ncbi:MAG: DUF885 family protein [Planctomycetota bacterium]|nr:DUF885 family protein [Planctomycetota bacterium]